MTFWEHKTVCITGATGSFGNAMARALLSQNVKAVRCLSRDELKQSEMEQRFRDPRLRFLLGDVRDRSRLHRAFDGCDVVINAAALKRVDKGSYDPTEFVATNVVGAQNIVEAALDAGVGRVVSLSTDKASAPLTLYGATKLVAEQIFRAANAYGGKRCDFLTVRYGNVVGSRGSLVPMLMEQAKTGTVTLTDERMTRFWMTLGDAVRLVCRAAEHGHPGTTLIPMLPAARVVDIIEAVAPGCAVEVIGIRGAEKLHESLISEDEAPYAWRGWMCMDAPEDYVLGLPAAPGIEGRYASDNRGGFLSVGEIRGRIPQAMLESAL